MKYLMDTCTFLWIISDNPALSKRARDIFVDPAYDIAISVVSLWEILVKHRLGKLPLPDHPAAFIERQAAVHRIGFLPLNAAAIWQLDKLPDYHRDPFDRMLICQAIAEGMILLTPDERIAQYPIRVEW